MGGYGTMRIGMKQAHAFGALYAMSSCCLMNDPAAGRGGAPGRGDAAGRGDAGRGAAPEGRGAAPGRVRRRGGGMANALSAQAAAWAPNPKNPPQFFDLPTKDGEIQPLVAAKWVANSPLVFVDQYVPSLRSMRAIALDVGNQDPFVTTNRQLADALDAPGRAAHDRGVPGRSRQPHPRAVRDARAAVLLASPDGHRDTPGSNGRDGIVGRE